MATVKERMDEARNLIKVKDYAKARTILKQIDHPRAKEWLEKIDELDPFGADEAKPTSSAKPVTNTSRAIGCFRTVFFYLVVVPILIGVALVVYSSINRPAPRRPAEFASLKERVEWVVENNGVGTLKTYGLSGKTILVGFDLFDLSEAAALDDAHEKSVKAACVLYEDGLTDYSVEMIGKAEMVDAFGQESTDDVVRIRFNPTTTAMIDCDNQDFVNVPLIADEYWVHQAILKGLE